MNIFTTHFSSFPQTRIFSSECVHTTSLILFLVSLVDSLLFEAYLNGCKKMEFIFLPKLLNLFFFRTQSWWKIIKKLKNICHSLFSLNHFRNNFEHEKTFHFYVHPFIRLSVDLSKRMRPNSSSSSSNSRSHVHMNLYSVCIGHVNVMSVTSLALAFQ